MSVEKPLHQASQGRRQILGLLTINVLFQLTDIVVTLVSIRAGHVTEGNPTAVLLLVRSNWSVVIVYKLSILLLFCGALLASMRAYPVMTRLYAWIGVLIQVFMAIWNMVQLLIWS